MVMAEQKEINIAHLRELARFCNDKAAKSSQQSHLFVGCLHVWLQGVAHTEVNEVAGFLAKFAHLSRPKL